MDTASSPHPPTPPAAATVTPETVTPAVTPGTVPEASEPATEPEAAVAPEKAAPAKARSNTRWILAAILLFAFILRAWNLDWDRGTHLQPDERFWSDVAANVQNPDDWSLSVVLDPERSPLNPRVYKPNYVYGTLPLWASEAAAGILMTDTMSPVVSALDGVGIDLARNEPADQPIRERLRFNTGYEVTIIGRLMSALIDTATVAAVFFLARELTDSAKTGLLAALLQSLTVLHIQYSHFLGSEPWVAFFVTLAVFGAVRLARGRGGWKTRVFTSIAVGFAIASKLSGIASVAAPFAAVLIAIGPDLSRLIRAKAEAGGVGRIARSIEPYLVMGLIAIIAYRVAQPYDFRAGISLVFNDRFSQDIEYLSDINSGGNWPWVQPLVGRTPLLHPLKQMFLWGMGPGLGLAAVFGILRATRRVFAGERYWAVPLAVIGSYFVLVSLQFYAIIRYLQPAYPIITVLSAAGLVAAWKWAHAAVPERELIAKVVKAAVVLSIGATVFWALAFVNGVYGNDNARIAAGDWMVENLEPDAVVSRQAWDDGLPWHRPAEFGQIQLEPFSFGGDAPDRIELLINGLDQVDYVIESSNKFYDSLPRTPARFPQMTEYYNTLFDGSLGFELVETFRNEPSLFGISIDDSGAEEAFTLYDHPTVFIWKKTEAFSVDRAYQLLNPERARTAINALPKDAFANASMLLPDEYVAQQTGSSFADVHSNDASGVGAALQWFVLIQIVSFSLAPVVLTNAGRAAGAAYGLTKPLGLIVFSLPVWLLVSWGVVDVSKPLIAVVLLAMIVGGIASARTRADRLRQIWQQHKRTIMIAEAVFVGAFLIVVGLRANNPDLWHPWRGGEKPMELAYLTAVTGSTKLPPFDPWLAGGSLNYYYMGWFVISVPMRLLGLAPDVGFNLGVATYAALAAATVFSTAAMLTELARRRSSRPMSEAQTGLIAVLFFMVVGNLASFRQKFFSDLGDRPLSQFDWWEPSRVNNGGGAPGFEVTEFPSWTVLFADLHPHFMAMSFFGLGLAGSIALIERTRQGRSRSSWILALGLGVGSGFIRMVHTWDFPTFALLAAGAVVFGWTIARGPLWWRVRSAVGQLLTVGVAHLAVTAPYRNRNQVADSGFSRSQSTTNLDDWMVHWGLFLFVGIAYATTRLWHRRDEVPVVLQRNLAPALGAAGLGFVGLHVLVGSVAAWAFAGLAIATALVLTELLDERPSTAHLVVAACWMLGFGVMIGVESFTQNADVARLNTVFKFWLQVWHLFAMASAFGVSWMLGPTLARAFQPSQAAPVTEVEGSADPERRWAPVFAGGLALLLLAALIFPVLAIKPRLADRFDQTIEPSLQGHLWLEPGMAPLGARDVFGTEFQVDPGQDRAIIEWLQANANGRPTVVEGVGPEYQWWGRISVTTGLPAVVGWGNHQNQQRTIFAAEVQERRADVTAFYTAQSQQEIDTFLRAYDVTYVIVGSLEAATADPRTLELLSQNPSLVQVFVDGDRAIYEVAKLSLAQARGPIAAIGAG